MTRRVSPDFAILGFMLVAAMASLSSAWIAQYGFGLFPCELCLYQRLPYIGIVALSLLALMPSVDGQSRRSCIQIGALLFATTAGVAAYHVGVEQGWWQSSCAPTGAQSFSVNDIRSALQQPGQPACNDVPLEVFGVSMAGYNFIWATMCACALLWSTQKKAIWTEGRPA